jgi:hypothetical protein
MSVPSTVKEVGGWRLGFEADGSVTRLSVSISPPAAANTSCRPAIWATSDWLSAPVSPRTSVSTVPLV